MSRVPSFTRPLRRAAALAIAGLVLASCGTAAVVASLVVTGVPSVSISVPLRAVACTPGATCVAVGGSNVGVGASSTGEYRRPDGIWTALPVPGLVGAAITSTSCWTDGCLLAGRSTGGDLVWRFHARSHAVTLAAAPSGGGGIAALSCLPGGACLALDTSASGVTRLLVSPDGAATWAAPTTLDWAAGLVPTALGCVDLTTCVVAAARPTAGPGSTTVVEVTRDGGATWTSGSVPASWRTLTSLSCRARACVALATTTSGARVALSSNLAGTWRGLDPHAGAVVVACTAARHCVVAGSSVTGRPWLATLREGRLVAATLRYVPSAPVAVACGTRICAAVSVSTVMSLAP